MPNKHNYIHDAYVSCKYYTKENSTEIKCKGICGSHTVNVFKTKAEKEEFKSDFCKGLNTSCPLYISLEIDTKDP